MSQLLTTVISSVNGFIELVLPYVGLASLIVGIFQLGLAYLAYRDTRKRELSGKGDRRDAS